MVCPEHQKELLDHATYVHDVHLWLAAAKPLELTTVSPIITKYQMLSAWLPYDVKLPLIEHSHFDTSKTNTRQSQLEVQLYEADKVLFSTLYSCEAHLSQYSRTTHVHIGDLPCTLCEVPSCVTRAPRRRTNFNPTEDAITSLLLALRSM